MEDSRNSAPKSEYESLRNQAALLQSAMDNMHQGLCMFDPEGRIAVRNRRFSEIIGLPPEAVRPGVSGRDLIEMSIAAGNFPGKTADEIQEELRANLKLGADKGSRQDRGGKSYSISHNTTTNGYWVATYEEISAQIAVEEALRESESRLSAILDAMPDCVKIFDQQGRLTYINPSGLELLQATDFESLTRPGYIAVPPEYLQQCMDIHARVIAGESAISYYEVVGLEGRRRHVEAHAVPIGMPDGSVAHLCISRDITERAESQAALTRSEERLRLVHEATGLADFDAGPDGIANCSDRMLEQLGLPNDRKSIPYEEWLKYIHPADRDRLQATIDTSLALEEKFQCEFRIIRADTGETRWISSHTKMERDETGTAIRSIGAHLDITDRKHAEEALRESEERFRLAVGATSLGVWDFDPAAEKQVWSDKFREILGLSSQTNPGLALVTQVIHPEDRAVFLDHLLKIRSGNEGGPLQESFRFRRANDQEERWVTVNGWRSTCGADETGRTIVTIRDVTDEKTAEARIRWAATHDPMTQLPNRTLFQDEMEFAIFDAAATGEAVGLLLLDIDHFKQINDSLGHDVGDLLLKTVAKTLRAAVRDGDTIARLGGDEFAIILPGLSGEEALEGVVGKLLEQLRQPFIHDGSVLDCKASIGASLYPAHGTCSEELLKSADIALYSAKSSGRGKMTVFRPELRDEILKRNSMVRLGKDAVESGRIRPYYQPKIDLSSGEIFGFEALLRWRDLDGKVQLPSGIAASFDDPDVAVAISDRILERTLADMRRWLDDGVEFDHVAINASAAEFRRGRFAEGVLEQLEKSGIPTCCLQLEVTETVFLGRGAEFVHHALNLLSQEGIKIALDDFGTGFASLRHLKDFPVDIIKVDKSFVRDMAADPGDEAIVRTVINLGQSLGIKVVAEGIETKEQLNRLIGFNCDYGQGFLFAKAVPARDVPGLLANARNKPWSDPRLLADVRPRLVASRD